jgi:tetratricopeptide (TPR) repeat protein
VSGPPEPSQQAPGRRPTGAIPAHWTVPAEVSASAVERPARAQADQSGGASKVIALAVVIAGVAIGAAFATGALDPAALGLTAETQPVADRPVVQSVTAPPGTAPSGTDAQPDTPGPEQALKAEPLVPTADNPSLVDVQTEPEPAVEPVPTPSVELDELPVRKKVNKLIAKGEGYVRKGRYKSAARVLEKAARLDPNYPRAQRSLGIARARLGDFEGARKAYTRYLELDPGAEDAADVRRILGQ